MALSDAQKKAVKDVLHLLVDSELHDLAAELIKKLPASVEPIAAGVEAAIEPVVQKAADEAIEKI